MKLLILILFPFMLSAQTSAFERWFFADGGANAHLLAGTAITFGASELDYHFTKNRFEAVLVGFIAGVGTTLIKEVVWDKALGRGVFSYYDVANGCWATLVTTIFNICRFDFIEKRIVDIDYYDSQIVHRKKKTNKWSLKNCNLLN